MRIALLALILIASAAGTPAVAAEKKNVCPEGEVTLTGTIGENRIFPAPEYWIAESAPCAIHVLELEKADEACAKGAKFTAKGKVEHVKEDGELSLVHIVKPSSYSCGK